MESKVALGASSSHISLAQGHFFLSWLMILFKEDLPGFLFIG